VAINLKLETVPPVIARMNVLEKQLIALRIPFMKMAVLPQGGQKGVKGPVIMVNSNVEAVKTSLPRPLTQESQIVAVKLKRKLDFKGYVHYQLVDTVKIEEALTFLMKNNPLYKDIMHNDRWLDSTEDVELKALLSNTQCVNDDQEMTNSQSSIIVQKHSSSDDEEIVEDTDDVNENEYERIRGVENDSCLQPPDLRTEVQAHLTDKIFSIAPAEGNAPISVFQEDMSEAKAFPTLFPNAKNTFDEPRPKDLTRSKYFNCRLLSADTRFAKDTQYIFYAQYCVELTKLISGISIAMRKGHMFKKDGTKITAKMLTNKDEVHEFLKADDAFEHMTALRGSPEYWNKTLSDLFAMIRQLGIPTWFCTFSAAELSRWPEVIETIELQNENVVDFSDLDWATKCESLRSNPVTAVRMFQERVANFMKTVINSPANPIGEVIDHFFRVEFQKRGAPHIHCLFWIKDAPKLDDDSDDEVCEFIDQYISSELPDEKEDPLLHEVVKTCQTHSKTHTKSCKKNNKECRYGFPKPASDATFIVRPKEDDDGDDYEQAKKKLEKLRELIEDNSDLSLTLDELHKEAGFDSQKDFQSALALVSQKEFIVMKRNVSDIWVNSYNPTLIQAWNANMDIQFVLNPYSCIMYIVSYISKSEKELGEILKFAREEMAEDTNSDLCKQMRKLGTVYIENREVSVQESVVRTCGLPLKDCSRDVIFVSSDKNSTRMSKSKAEIENAAKSNGDEDNIWLTSKLEKYRARPKNETMNGLCHASCASEYRDICKTEANRLIESGNLGYMLKRTRGKPAIIRYAKYSETRDPEKYFYSMLRLFLPHYTEEQLKPPTFDSYENFYKTGSVALTPGENPVPVKFIVDENKAKFDHGGEQLTEAFNQLKTHGPLEDAWSLVAPQTEQNRIDAEDEIAQTIDEIELGADGVVELKEAPTKIVSLCSVELTKEAAIQPMLKHMNEKQKKIFYSIRQWALDKVNGNNPDPIFLHISGGGGVGKSHLIKCIYYCITHLLKDKNNPDDPSVLLTAPTGTAAFTVGGFTVHSALKIPLKLPKQASEIKNLGPDQLNSLQAKLSNLQLLIIDEISMVNRRVLHCIHKRLKQVKRISMNDKTAYFGNVSVLAVGDMYQLPPVKACSLIVPNREEGIDLWHDLFKIVELDEIMRQKDDQTFAKLLNRMRTHQKGKPLKEEDKKILENRNDLPQIPVDALHVFATNAQAEKHNNDMLVMKCETPVRLEAQDYSKDETSGKMTRKTSVTKGSPDDLCSVLQLGVGCRVMLMRNIDVTDGLVNGAFGTVMGFGNPNKEGIITEICVKFDNEKIGLKAGNHDRTDFPKGSVFIDQFEEDMHNNERIKRRQFPLKLGWGTTIHKTQGLTVQQIVYDMKKTFTYGQAYVALSRVTKLSGLYLKNFDPKVIYRNEKVHENLQLMPSYFPEIAKNEDEPALTILHHNVQGLRSKMEDLMHNSDVISQDVIMLSETHLNSEVPDEKVKLPMYNIRRRDRQHSAGGGVAVHITQDLEFSELELKTSLELMAVKISGRDLPPITLVVVYRSQTESLNSTRVEISKLLKHFDEKNMKDVVVIGDLNENLLSSSGHPIQETFGEFGYVQQIEQATTIYGSLLDVIYTKLTSFPCNIAQVVPTYYSDHEATLLMLYLKSSEVSE
jgi:DNA replication protein DnaC/predicted peroxiredoxin